MDADHAPQGWPVDLVTRCSCHTLLMASTRGGGCTLVHIAMHAYTYVYHILRTAVFMGQATAAAPSLPEGFKAVLKHVDKAYRSPLFPPLLNLLVISAFITLIIILSFQPPPSPTPPPLCPRNTLRDRGALGAHGKLF